MVRQSNRLIGFAHGDYELPTRRTELVRIPNGFGPFSLFSGWGIRI
jgi:hypothetical protein